MSDGSLSKQPANHVHLWKAGSVTEQIDHKAKTKEVQIPVKEWDEEVWSKDEKQVCLNCVWNKKPKQGESWVDIDGDGKWTAQEEGQIYFKDFRYDTASDLEAHQSGTTHGQAAYAKVLLDTIHHPTADEPKYETTTVITEKAWSEYYQDYTCRVYGEKMKERNIRGNPTKGKYNGLLIPSKSGYIINAYGERKMSVSANMAYPASIYNGKQITSEQSLSKYGFCYLGEESKSDNILLPDTYLQLLKDHNIQ